MRIRINRKRTKRDIDGAKQLATPRMSLSFNIQLFCTLPLFSGHWWMPPPSKSIFWIRFEKEKKRKKKKKERKTSFFVCVWRRRMCVLNLIPGPIDEKKGVGSQSGKQGDTRSVWFHTYLSRKSFIHSFSSLSGDFSLLHYSALLQLVFKSASRRIRMNNNALHCAALHGGAAHDTKKSIAIAVGFTFFNSFLLLFWSPAS